MFYIIDFIELTRKTNSIKFAVYAKFFVSKSSKIVLESFKINL